MKKLIYLLLVVSLISFVNSTNINTCQNITSSGYYELTGNLVSSGTCIQINVSNVDLNCNSFSINHSNSVPGSGINGYFANQKTNITIRNCVIFDSGVSSQGIALQNTNYSYLLNNSVKSSYGNPSTIYLNNFKYGLINSNNLSKNLGNDDPIFMEGGSDYTNFTNNYVYHYSTDGVGATGVQVRNSQGVLVENNYVYMYNSTGSYAMRARSTSVNNIYRNNFAYSELGRSMWASSSPASNNQIYGNILNSSLGNSDVSSLGNFWNNSLGGNYYANPTGNAFSQNASCNDVGLDGICDNSLIISAQSTDYMPLSQLPAWYTTPSTPAPASSQLSVSSLPSTSFVSMVISLGLILFILF